MNAHIHGYAAGELKTGGGAERQQWLLARALANRGHEVVCSALYPYDFQPEIEGVWFSSPKTRNPVTNVWSMLSQERPDWWYYRTRSYHLSWFFFIAHRLNISTIFAVASDTDCTPRKALTQRKYLWPLYMLGLEQSDRIFVQHTRQMQLLSPRYRKKSHIIPNIIDLPTEHLHQQKAGYIAWVGNLRDPKRPHLMVEIAQTMPDVQFVVCGGVQKHQTTPGYGEQVAAQLAETPNIHYHGFTLHSKVCEIIGNASILLSTSFKEGFPNTFLEAWGQRVPVVTFGIDPGGVVEQNKLGKVTSSVDETVSTLRYLLEHPVELHQLGENGREYVNHWHLPEIVCEQLENTLS